jgi:hypothetical protein
MSFNSTILIFTCGASQPAKCIVQHSWCWPSDMMISEGFLGGGFSGGDAEVSDEAQLV